MEEKQLPRSKSADHLLFIEHMAIQEQKCLDISVVAYSLCDLPKFKDDSTSLCKLPMAAFNHIGREVLDVEISKKFYCHILGFESIPRPDLGCDGVWLSGYGLNLHLVQTKFPGYRKDLRSRRIDHFSKALPRVDHIAFTTQDLTTIRNALYEANVFLKEEEPKETGIKQIFLFDPDGNVIEISNCGPNVGEVTCMKERSFEAMKHDQTLRLSAIRKLRECGVTEEEIIAIFRSTPPMLYYEVDSGSSGFTYGS